MSTRKLSRISSVVNELKKRPGLAFRELVPAAIVEETLSAAGVTFRNRIYDPVVTLLAFLSQTLSTGGSCREAVDRVNAQRVVEGRKPASPDTSSYCRARRRLPESMLRHLSRKVATKLEDQAPSNRLWLGHHVKIVDGSTSRMPDTRANRMAFGQPSGQKLGLGFPQLRMTVVFSLCMATVLDAAIGPYAGKGTGEISLFRRLFHAFAAGDVVLGDCLYDNFRDIAALIDRRVHCVFGINQSRRCDFRRGKRRGIEDHLVTWEKPRFNRSRIDRTTYDALPDFITMRELRIRIQQPGFRTKVLVVVTTLLDPDKYPKQEIANLFRARWHCELDLRCLKPVLGLDELRCKTPGMVRREFWMHMLAYNLIRLKMAEAASEHGLDPRHLSFTGALTAIRIYLPKLAGCTHQVQVELHAMMLRTIASRIVGDRPNRYEPRAKKRRQTKYPYLTTPRQQLKQAALRQELAP
jgi:hypothetical protein